MTDELINSNQAPGQAPANADNDLDLTGIVTVDYKTMKETDLLQAEDLLQMVADINLANRQRIATIDLAELQRQEVKAGKRATVDEWARIQEALLYAFQEYIGERNQHVAFIATGYLMPELIASAKRLGFDVQFKILDHVVEHVQPIVAKSVNNEGFVIPESDWAKTVAEFKRTTNKKLIETAVDLAKTAHERFLNLKNAQQEMIWSQEKDQVTPILDKLRKKSKPRHKTILNDLLIMPNNKLVNKLDTCTDPQHLDKMVSLKIADEYSKGNFHRPAVVSTVICSYENLPENIKAQINPEDLLIHDAVCSLYNAALRTGDPEPVITTENIYKAMPGASARITDQERDRIVRTIEKMSSLRVTIDASQELTYRNVSDKETKIISQARANVLYTYGAEFREVNENGEVKKKANAWKLLHEPILYTYAKAVGQVISIPIEYLEAKTVDEHGKITDKPIKMSPTRRTIYTYLLQRVSTIKRTAQQSPNILFDTIFEKSKLDDDNDTEVSKNPSNDRIKQEKRYREFIIQCLDFMIAKAFIKNYEILQRPGDRTPYGVKIIVERQELRANQ